MGYNSQDELPIIFGLGKRDKIDSLEITWPSGQVQNLENIEIKQTITITEPS